MRFAMVHDVIHERFPRHGSAYYEERNRRVSAALKEEEAKAGRTPKQSDFVKRIVDKDRTVPKLRDGARNAFNEAMRKKGKNVRRGRPRKISPG